jgi:hypothetical protein
MFGTTHEPNLFLEFNAFQGPQRLRCLQHPLKMTPILQSEAGECGLAAEADVL